MYQLQAVRTAYLITGERPIAEDVVMDAFLMAYDHIGQFDTRRSFFPWFYRIVVNNALMAIRKAHHAPAHNEQNDHALQHCRSPAPEPEDAVLRWEIQQALVAALDTLPPNQRAALVLRCYLGMDEAAIARTLGCPLGTVKWRLHAARRRLRGTFSNEFGTPRLSAEGGR